ncbi:MAG TPA: hypothetical protein VFR86_14035, partial [Burkholderiaceae bacterium]|nr:hypothetical protein [Burkholderiaceae bacterium]
ALAVGGCGVLGYACADAFVTRLAPEGSGVTPAVNVSVNVSRASPGGTVTATWAGLVSTSGEDELRLYRIGSEYHEFVATWSTGSAPAGSMSLQLPADATPGWYEIRLMNLDRYSALVTVARSDVLGIGVPGQ